MYYARLISPLSKPDYMSLAQLDGAKALVREDPSQYPQIIDQLKSISQRPEVALRRWCALFFMDAVTSLELAGEVKVGIAKSILPSLSSLCDDPDPQVVKIATSVAATIYPGLFQDICQFRSSSDVWAHLTKIKQIVFAIWDLTTHTGIKAAAIKFAQVVVHTQSKAPPGVQEPNLLLVQGNPILDPVILSAEAQGLLDRILSYYASSTFNPSLVSATLNCTLILAKTRPVMAPKIINSICSIKLETKHGLESYVSARFVDKALQLNLRAVAKDFSHHTDKIHRFIAMVANFNSSSILRKRAAVESDTGAKRVKTDMPVVATTRLEEESAPLTQLYKLVENSNVLAQFNARDLPHDIAVKIALSGLKKTDPALLKNCIHIITQRLRHVEVQKKAPEDHQVVPQEAAPAPSPQPKAQEKPEPKKPDVLTLDLPGDKTINNLLNRLVLGSKPPAAPASGLMRTIDHEQWIYVVSRLAARATSGETQAKIREYLYTYVMTDFRKYLDLMIVWLSEEWFAGSVLGHQGVYGETLERILESILPRMEVSDSKTLIRLLSDVPELSAAHINKLESVCQDPDRSLLGTRALRFLCMLKPPARAPCIELAKRLEKVDGMEKLIAQFDK